MNSVHEAAVAGNSEKLKLLIENGTNVNLKDSKGLRPLHFAAWQGRTESVFILLRAGANVNEQSFEGDTSLHLASQYGHHEIVQLLLFHHADPTLLNRRLLTPIELACEHGHFHVVNSLVHNRLCQQMILTNTNEQHSPLHLAAKNGHTDIVRLLLMNGIDINQFSDAILVRAIRSYTDNHVGALNFNEGDCITVFDRNPTGQWRGFILQEDLTTRTGYFPSTYVQLNRSIINGKEIQPCTDNHSFSDIDSMSRSSQVDSALTTISNWSSRARRHSPMNNIYRHSAASSIDSGRSSTLIYDSPKTLALSSFMSIGDARSISSSESKSSDPDKTSYRSSSSSLDESGVLNINKLLRSGISENEIVYTWLREFSYENYAENFITHGYDIQTIARMTPEDLTAIGITHPSHRRKIKNEIVRLHLPDGLPDFKPDTLYDWLYYLRLDEYMSLLSKQNYKMLSDITSIAWEDLEDIGITRLGHQKRFMLGIKRLIDIDKGHYQPNPNKINNPSIKQSKSTIERCNSLEHNRFIRPTTNGDSSAYATLRKPHCSPNSLMSSKQRNGSAGTYMPALSFRLPPPLSSAVMNSSTNNFQPISTSRTRSLENINMNQRKLEAHINQYESVTSQYAQISSMMNNLGSNNDTNLSSSTDSTNCIPFANENMGTIKQRSLVNHYDTLTVKQPFDTMKRGLPIDFFQPATIHAITTTAIYDSNECCTRKTSNSPHKQILKPSLITNERDILSVNTDENLQFIETSKKTTDNKTVKNDATNVLSDIDSMLSDLNRELDQMLDYEPTTSIRS
ncbi:unnamed protein product [Rotaria magnacalcarata]|uniref:Caskin-1 n=1 Tax=Rotaria magnacalcarata TaxID=392030 RepID=A0A8S2K364_9BILA|nr:unnamed protein product [Rotaria magnacalcarata]